MTPRIHAASLRLLTAAGVVCCSACDDPLVDPQTVIELRILGARVRAAEEPERAQLDREESATVDWLVVADQPREFSARGVFCRAAPTALGVPRCDGEPFAEFVADGDSGAPVSAGFTLPAVLRRGDEWLGWLGLCEDSVPEFLAAGNGFECGPGDIAKSAFYRSTIASDATEASGDLNTNPNTNDDTLWFDDAPWLDSDPGLELPCGQTELPSLRAGRSAQIRFELGGDDRDALHTTEDSYAAPPREALVFTHVATHPGLDRAFSAIEDDDTELDFDVDFRLPEQDSFASFGERVRFYLVVRDGRGGVDWLDRAFCAHN
jgi:hypothetical protein